MTTINICLGECLCCIDKIYSSIKNDKREWEEMEREKLSETPLHRAAAAGNKAVAVEILNLIPSLGRKLNTEGLSPLHVAIKKEQTETAIAIASFDKQLVRVKGKEGVTPLMLCAAEGHRELLAELLVECPDSVLDVNNRKQTVVHVAMEYGHCEVVGMLVHWLRRTAQLAAVLSVNDADGNTALHAAAQSGCLEGARSLVDVVNLNRRNIHGKTALDVAEVNILNDNRRNDYIEIVKLLKRKGARRGNVLSRRETMADYARSKPTYAEGISRAFYYLTKELTLEMRNTILVVATLIIAATYQVVLQPPAGIYPPPAEENNNAPPPAAGLKHHLAGQMVMQLKQYQYFMPLNTFAFALSAVIIIFVVPGSPVFLILHLCLVFMCLSYLLALDAISYYTDISKMIYFMASYAVFGAYIVKILYYPIKALFVEEDWWLRRFSIKFSNFWDSLNHSSYASAAIGIAYQMKNQHVLLRRKN